MMDKTLEALERLHINVYNIIKSGGKVSPVKLEKALAKIITIANEEVSLHGNE
jgi:hypothetical protein